MATEDLIAEALQPSRSFNWLFLVTLLVCGTLAIFFLFYFNRLFATLISYGIRAYSWHAFHAYIDIQALQISLLGGRIFFKGLRYHAHNETILVNGGYITWQYWLRKVKDAQIFDEEPPEKGKDSEKGSSSGSPKSQSQSRTRNRSIGREEKGGKRPERQLPCRIDIKVSGVEAFLYNRSPAYDLIVDSIAKKEQQQNGSFYASAEKDTSSSSSLDEKPNGTAGESALPGLNQGNIRIPLKDHANEKLERAPTTQSSHWIPQTPAKDASSREPPAFLRLLPIRVRCKKGAIVLGNENTRCVTTAKFENATGELDAGRSGPLDIFKLLVNFEVEHPVVQLHPNHDFKGTQLASAVRKKHESGIDGEEEEEGTSRRTWLPRGNRPGHMLSRLAPLFRRSVDSVATATGLPNRKSVATEHVMEVPGQARWQGLTRYLEEDQHNEHDEWDPVEYARLPTLADLSKVKVAFYWDIPGPVPGLHDIQDSSYMTDTTDINGSNPPEYGLDIAVFGGVVNYGPWTDRERINIQSVFFPPIYTDAIPAERIKPGQDRYSTVFKIFVSVEEDIVLRLPVRESSKDWKWKGHAEAYQDQNRQGPDKQKGRGQGKRRRGKKQDRGLPASNVRPFGWFDAKIATDTTVNYTMDMVAGLNGYANAVDVDVTKLEITTSVNHNVLWRSGRQLVTCDLSNPLQWNRLREWTFSIGSHDTEIFLLTDHLVLLLDLITDWGSGPQADFYTFLSMRYLLNVDFHNFKLYINTNDSNIINNPSDLDDNNFIILFGRLLSGKVTIPLDRFRPVQNSVLFDAIGRDFGLEMCSPSRNTIDTFMPDKIVARLSDLKADGSHNFFSDTDPGLTDRLIMNIHGGHFSLDAYGFLLRQFVNFKENYFGEDLHFKTLEEFQGMPARKSSQASTITHPGHTEKSNALDVILCISAEDTNIQLPANLYDKKDSIRLELATASLDLRFTNYYMDMMLNTSPLGIALGTTEREAGTPDDASSGTQIFLDGVNMYGHRLFGLPPAEPAYMGDWNLDVGAITGECTSSFLSTFVKAGRAIAFTLPDVENAMPISHPTVIHDVTFLKVRTKPLRLWLHIDQDALLVSTGAINVDFNDWAGPLFSQRLGVLVPDVSIACLDARSALRHRTRQGERMTVETYALIQTNLQLHMMGQSAHFNEEREKQQIHLSLHDQKTQRANFLLEAGRRHGDGTIMPMGLGIDPPAMAFPPVPGPLARQANRNGNSVISDNSSITNSVRSMRSFASSLQMKLNNEDDEKRESDAEGGRRSTTTLNRSRSQSPLTPTNEPKERRSSPSHPYSSFYRLPTEEERKQRGLAPSTVAFSSPFACPYFPLDACQPETKDMPTLPPISAEDNQNGSSDAIFADATASGIDESMTHVSFIVKVEPGVSILCKPQAIECVANIIDTVLSKTPEDLLDDFQFGVITEILSIKTRKRGNGKSLDFSIQVPFVHLRFLATFSNAANGVDGNFRDQYDIVLDRVAVSARTKEPSAPANEKDSTSVHATVSSLTVSATEVLPEKVSSEVALRLDLHELLLWVVSKNRLSIDVSFKDCAAALVSKKVDYLASLVHRDAMMAERYESKFKRLISDHQDRLRYLTYELTTSGGDIPDPPFLTRATYALRAADDHVRINDSWKILSRFRYIYSYLPAARKREIAMHCRNQNVVCPLGAEASVIKSWEGWRSWDLAHIKDSVAMRFLYGAIEDIPELHKRDPIPVSVAVRSGALRLLVDPGPRQNELAFDTLALGLSVSPPQQPSGLMLVDSETPTVSTTVQVNTFKTDIKISWEILELVEALFDLFKEPLIQKSNEEKLRQAVGVSSRSSTENPDQKIHVVFATDHASVTLDTINIRHTAKSKAMKISVAGQMPGDGDEAQSFSALAHAEAAASEIFGHERLLWRTRIDAPTISVAHNRPGRNSGQPDDLKIAGATEELVIDIKEEILGLMEVVDSVIGDEVAYIHKQVVKHRGDIQATTPEAPEAQRKPPRIQVALFMGTYKIDAALLRSLNYSLSGGLSSLAITPDESKQYALDFDYDLSAQIHEIVNITPNQSHVISGLEFPPINGRVKYSRQGKEDVLTVQTTIERIDLQAADINALAIALSRPEVINCFKAIKHDGLALKDRTENIVGKFEDAKPQSRGAKNQEVFVYDIRVTLVGFSIEAKAPATSDTKSTASIIMSLEGTQVTATNRLETDSAILRFPEVRARLGQIKVALQTFSNGTMTPCGDVSLGLLIHCTSQKGEDGEQEQRFIARSSGIEVNVYAETASVVVDCINHMQDKIKDLDLSKEATYIRKIRHARKRSLSTQIGQDGTDGGLTDTAAALLASSYSLELRDIQISWVVDASVELYEGQDAEDLVLSFKRIDLSTQKTDEARLLIESMQLQMVPRSRNKRQRSLNSALFPELVFNVAYESSNMDRSLAFHAAGKRIEFRLQSYFVLPAIVLQRSISSSIAKCRKATATWEMTPTTSGTQRKDIFGSTHINSLIIDADFVGAIVHLERSSDSSKSDTSYSPLYSDRIPQQGKFGQFAENRNDSITELHTPGIALKLEYQDRHGIEPSLKAEILVDASTNILYPTFVPFVMEISKGIKEVVRENDEDTSNAVSKAPQKLIDEELIGTDPSTLLGKTRLNLGVRVCKQEFSLTCHPYARVAASAKFEDIYLTVNTIQSAEQGNFFAISAAFTKLEAKVRHVYSRDDTFRVDVESIVLSLMNSKHFSGKSGVSAILKMAPAKTILNVKQLQDFLLFREIWIPPEIRSQATATPASPEPALQAQEYLVQKYHQVTSVAAFPWNASIAIAQLALEIDLGQSIGKSAFTISKLWVHSKKDSNWEQNLCAGIGNMGVDSTGRMSGYVDLQGFRLRTSIAWPLHDRDFQQTPLIQASLGFEHLRVKAAFDYQAFAIADITNFDFLMYNVREQGKSAGDRLVAMLDGDKVQVFCTATSAAQALALVQAFDRLIQEKQAAFTQSLKEIETSLKRKSVAGPSRPSSVHQSSTGIPWKKNEPTTDAPIRLHTDVMVTLRSLNVGAFPSTFFDNQIFKLEAEATSARFAVTLEDDGAGKIHSALGMTLGQLRVALSSVRTSTMPKPLGEVTVEEVVSAATGSRGGTILKVPKVVATMSTWQAPDNSNHIDYTFRSSFEGKVDVGWNYSRISFIRTMWGNHSRSLASRLGKPLPESAVKITAGPSSSSSSSAPSAAMAAEKPDTSLQRAGEPSPSAVAGAGAGTAEMKAEGEKREQQEKITAVVNVPQSRYEYAALEPPVIETPQLRDMGEATPPLEWIGLHRERLPNITHQIVIVTLLEVAKEVEDAYERILGSNLAG
ncbi:hypothetical protein EV356DRAFT_477194 [Viridothelium virens]|uniref:Fermentation associated protein n=1 Tax=Viridothelium virens TaxID=1048519 RepID=A0A6A6HQT3_VIRVR|nr:hypothetical protein EV356DRAFT_477194 [Viridothelium virens]